MCPNNRIHKLDPNKGGGRGGGGRGGGKDAGRCRGGGRGGAGGKDAGGRGGGGRGGGGGDKPPDPNSKRQKNKAEKVAAAAGGHQ